MEKFEYRSPYIGNSNKEYSWFSIDSENLYQKNFKEKFSQLSENGWIDKKITYKFNSVGFRSEEFNSGSGILCLGCSFTFGLGLPYENVWPVLLSKKLNLSCWNLGSPGGSNDTAFRLGAYYIPKLRPKIVALLTPPKDRIEVIKKNDGISYYFLPNQVSEPEFTKFYDAWLANESNSILNRKKNVFGLAHICNQYQIPFVSIDFENIRWIVGDLARDLSHPGIRTQQHIFEDMYSLINLQSTQ